MRRPKHIIRDVRRIAVRITFPVLATLWALIWLVAVVIRKFLRICLLLLTSWLVFTEARGDWERWAEKTLGLKITDVEPDEFDTLMQAAHDRIGCRFED